MTYDENEAYTLIEELKDYGISQAKVAAFLGITANGLSFYMLGKRSGSVMFRTTGEKMSKLRGLVAYVRQAKQPKQQSIIVPAPAPHPPQVVESVQTAQDITAIPRQRIEQVKRVFFPQRANSQGIEVDPPQVWPIGVPVNPPLEPRITLAWGNLKRG